MEFILIILLAPFVIVYYIVKYTLIGALNLYCYIFFKSDKFQTIKDRLVNNTKQCNELNQHIESLKAEYTNFQAVDYGKATYLDASRFNFKRPNLKDGADATNWQIYDCSLSVCKNAQNQPFKYLCKYFNIKSDERTLENFEGMLNNFAAAEQGKQILGSERQAILDDASNQIPFLIRKFRQDRFFQELGFDQTDFSDLYFPHYRFQYISGGGNSSMRCDIILDVDNLNRFVQYLSELVKFRKSAAEQRALMTTALREEIKERDHYTCKKCKNSTSKEPNLLLEIDHIIPISKGGLTERKNLQTLCWRCNRHKGAKIDI